MKPGANICKYRYVKKEEKNVSYFILRFEERLGMSTHLKRVKSYETIGKIQFLLGVGFTALYM